MTSKGMIIADPGPYIGFGRGIIRDPTESKSYFSSKRMITVDPNIYMMAYDDLEENGASFSSEDMLSLNPGPSDIVPDS